MLDGPPPGERWAIRCALKWCQRKGGVEAARERPRHFDGVETPGGGRSFRVFRRQLEVSGGAVMAGASRPGVSEYPADLVPVSARHPEPYSGTPHAAGPLSDPVPVLSGPSVWLVLCLLSEVSHRPVVRPLAGMPSPAGLVRSVVRWVPGERSFSPAEVTLLARE